MLTLVKGTQPATAKASSGRSIQRLHEDRGRSRNQQGSFGAVHGVNGQTAPVATSSLGVNIDAQGLATGRLLSHRPRLAAVETHAAIFE